MGGGGGWVRSGLQHILFQPFRLQFGLKIGEGGGGGPPGPSPGSAAAKGLPGHSVPLLLLAFTGQLNISATALILHDLYAMCSPLWVWCRLLSAYFEVTWQLHT